MRREWKEHLTTRSDRTRSSTSNGTGTFSATSTFRSSSGILSVAFGDP